MTLGLCPEYGSKMSDTARQITVLGMSGLILFFLTMTGELGDGVRAGRDVIVRTVQRLRQRTPSGEDR